MKVVITGGTGLLASRLATFLEKQGVDVTLLSQKKSAQLSCIGKVNVSYVDYNDYNLLLGVFNNADAVIHTASLNASECANDVIKAYQINTLLTAEISKAVISSGVNRLIYLSTAHVYRAPLVGKISTSSSLNNPHPYASSKLAGEHAATSILQNSSVKLQIIRLSNAFGYPDCALSNCWNLYVNELCKEAVLNRTLTVRSNRNINRDFLPISYFLLQIEYLLNCPLNTKCSVYNIGAGYSMSLSCMAELICERFYKMFDMRLKVNYLHDRFFVDSLQYKNDVELKPQRKVHDLVKLEIDDLLSYIVRNRI